MKRGSNKSPGSIASEIDPKLFAHQEDPFLTAENSAPKETNPPLAVALKLLNSKDYTRQKLRYVLNTKGINDREITECISRLEAWGYLNDREYGVRRLEVLQKRLKSRLFIRHDLIGQGLSEELVDCLLEEGYPERAEVQIAEKFLAKRSRIKRKNQFWGVRALQQAGFSENTIHRCFPE